MMEIANALKIEERRLKRAIGRGTIEVVKNFVPRYLVFKKKVGHVEKGTTIFLARKKEIIRGFPEIKRAFYLKSAIQHFKGDVAVEEKMNGYNARVFLMEGKVFALTRGGYVCPYTTSRLRQVPGIRRILENDQVLCGEVVGKENPYVARRYEEAERFGFFVFDIREKVTNVPMQILKRNKLLADAGVQHVRLFGIFQKDKLMQEIFRILSRLEKENREGIVLKDPEMIEYPIKYTPSKTNISDLERAFEFPYDQNRDLFFSLIMREAYQALETCKSKKEIEERAFRLGRSILYPAIKTMKKIMVGENVEKEYIVRVKSKEEIKKLVEHLKERGISCKVGEMRKEGSEIVVRITRLKHATRDKIKKILEKGTE
jgi:putative ATP-dependent DNA ligase